MNTLDLRPPHLLLIKEGFRGLAPQASAIPGFATARLWKYIFHSSTTSLADVSGFARKSFGGASGGPSVTRPLPAPYKPANEPAESGRQTLLEYVLIAPVPCSKPVAIQNAFSSEEHV